MTVEPARDVDGLLAVGRVVRGTIAAMEAALHPGVTTAELDLVAQQFLAHAGARSAPMTEVWTCTRPVSASMMRRHTACQGCAESPPVT